MALVLVPAAPASAHASLLTTTPAAGYSVASSPPALTLVFDQPVSVRGTPLRLDGPGGTVELGAARLSNGDRWLTAPVPRPLARGQYARQPPSAGSSRLSRLRWLPPVRSVRWRRWACRRTCWVAATWLPD